MLKQIKKKNENTNKNLKTLVNSVDSAANDLPPNQIPINIFTLIEDLKISKFILFCHCA